jgi:hypothetical protein
MGDAVRIAALLRELADEIENSATPVPTESRPRPRRERKPRAIVRPAGETPPDVARLADKLLREKGFR